jgi:LPXTG-motif cell wall-anchored protein
MDGASGRLQGTPELPGNYTIVIKARDGRGGECRQDFTLRVADSVLPAVTLDAPAGKVRGALRLAGGVVRGTREVLRVEVRLDGGEWRVAALNSTWSLTVDSGKLRDGEHVVEVRAYDGWENSTTVKGTFEVDNSKVIQTGGMDLGAGLALAGAIGIAVVAAGAFVLARRRKNAHK